MPTFGQRLRQLRRAAGLSQGELAGEDLSASYVSLLEADKRSPSDEVIHLLSSRLGCSRSQLMEGRPSDRDRRIELEMAYAKLAVEHGESGDARDRLQNLLAEDGLDLATRDRASLLLATANQLLGENRRSIQLLLPLMERASRGDADASVVDVGQILCRSYLDAGDLNQAINVGERSLSAARRQGLNGTTEFFRLAATVMAAHLGLGDLVHARTWAEPLIDEAEQAGQLGGQAALYWNSAVAADLEGRPDEAVRLCEKALARLGELDNLRDYARVRMVMAQFLLYLDVPEADRAKLMLESALPDLQDHASRIDHAAWNRAMSMALLVKEDLSGAEGRARQAADLARGQSDEDLVEAWLSLYDALAAQGRSDEAYEYLNQARQALLRIRPSTRSSAILWRECAERMLDAGRPDEAASAYQRALDCTGVRDHSAGVRAATRKLRRRTAEATVRGSDRG